VIEAFQDIVSFLFTNEALLVQTVAKGWFRFGDNLDSVQQHL
jgi:hypothetical protein